MGEAGLRGRLRRGSEQVRLLRQASRPGAVGFFWWDSANLGDASMWFAAQALFPADRLVPYPRINRSSSALRRRLTEHVHFDIAICGGGTLISHEFFRGLEDLRQRSSIMIALGTGVGSPGIESQFGGDTPEQLADLAKCMSQFDELHLRGPSSVEAARAAGYQGRLTQSGDMVLALTPDSIVDAPRDDVVFIPGYEFVPEVRSRSDDVVRTLMTGRRKVTFLSMNPLDDPRAAELAARFDRPVILSREVADPDTFMQTIGRFEAMVSFRLHGAVYGAMLGIPSVLVQTVRKMGDFMTTVGADDFCVPFDTVDPDEIMSLLDAGVDFSGVRRSCLDTKATLTRLATELISCP